MGKKHENWVSLHLNCLVMTCVTVFHQRLICCYQSLYSDQHILLRVDLVGSVNSQGDRVLA